MPPAPKRIQDDQGYTLVELLIVVVIFSILVTIALPSYLSFRERANDSAAKTAIRNLVPAAVLYNGDHKTGYTGMTTTKLKLDYAYDVKRVSIFLANKTTYCLKSRVGVRVWYKGGPGGTITTTKPAGVCP